MVHIEALIVDRREPEEILDMITEAVIERRGKTGLGTKLCMPNVGELKHGDYQIVVKFNKSDFKDGKNAWAGNISLSDMTFRIPIERKTMSDALSNWGQSKASLGKGKSRQRFDIQLYDLIESTDGKTSMAAFILEHSYVPPKLLRTNRYWAFLRHVNYLEMCVLPVVRTKSKRDTAKYLVYLMEKIVKEEFNTYHRPLELIDEGDLILSMLAQLPEVGPDLAKKIKESFTGWQAFLTACKKHIELHKQAQDKAIPKAQMDRESPLIQIKDVGRKLALQISVVMCDGW